MKKIKYLLFVFIIVLIGNKDVLAAKLSVSANANIVKVGQSVTISVYGRQMAGTFDIKVSDESILSGATSGSIYDDTNTYIFIAKSPGDVTVTITPVDLYELDSDKKYTRSTYVTLRVIAGDGETNTTTEKKQYSSDNYLSSLSVDGYDITPQFDKDNLEYTLDIDKKIEKVVIKAKANSELATVTGTGDVKLSVGENILKVKVVAENGNEKIYKIVINVFDETKFQVAIDNENYTIIRKNNNYIQKITGFKKTKIKVNNQEIEAYVNKNEKVTLVILKDSKDNYNYYIYDKKNKEVFTLYREIKYGDFNLSYIEMPKDTLSDDYIAVDFSYNDDIFKGYQNDNKDIYLFYALDMDNGEYGIYQFNSIDNTIKKYSDVSSDVNLKSYYKYFIISGLLLILLLLLLLLVISKRSKKRR